MIKIDRKKLVQRHNILQKRLDILSPLSIGNGELAYTADITGFQTFSHSYEDGIPLCTQSQWGWHTQPYDNQNYLFDLNNFKYTKINYTNKILKFPDSSQGQKKAYNWLRENPHRMNLVKTEILLNNKSLSELKLSDLSKTEQRLDLWTGLLTSNFNIGIMPVEVNSLCHPELDLLAFHINSELIKTGQIFFNLKFPYGSSDITASDWYNNKNNHTDIINKKDDELTIVRTLDQDNYYVKIKLPQKCIISKVNENNLTIIPDKSLDNFEFCLYFTKLSDNLDIPDYNQTKIAAQKSWAAFWLNGGIIETINSDDSRAFELERRLILSQYLTKIQCSGSLPPQETGLTCNSWYGKFHLEMHWWHTAHFPLWNRSKLLAKSLKWYLNFLPQAKLLAKSNGYTGAKWPKMTSFNGQESPSLINPYIIWQQPHPIYLAELIFRSKPTKSTLNCYHQLVFETAEHMASFVHFNENTQEFELSAPIIPAQENHKPLDTINPTFELEYWAFGLKTALTWQKRLGLPINKLWTKILNNLSPLKIAKNAYIAHENCLDTFENFNSDHPSMLAALGMLPGNLVDKKIMDNTLKKVIKHWQMDTTWGWDFPLIAMTAARLGCCELAIDILFCDAPNNTYLLNGHNIQKTRKELPVYLPGNGGLLTAVGMMAAGWDNCPIKETPGFPNNDKWHIKWEDINPLP